MHSGHLEILRLGVGFWNDWREENPGIEPQLSGVSNADLLSGLFLRWDGPTDAESETVDLNGINFSNCALRGAQLQGVHLHRANLSGAQLSEADLSGADLRDTDLTRTDFGNAVLKGAYLRDGNMLKTDFGYADLTGADCEYAQIVEANFWHANLSGASLEGASLTRADFRNSRWNETNVSHIAYRRRELANRCYGMSGDGIYGDAVFRRDVMDQNYIDTLKVSILNSIAGVTFVPYRFGWNWKRHAIPLSLLKGFYGAGPLVGLAAAFVLAIVCFSGTQRGLPRSGDLSALMRTPLTRVVLASCLAGFLAGGFVSSGIGQLFILRVWGLFDYGRSWSRVLAFAVLSIGGFGFLYAIADKLHVQFTHTGPTVGGIFYPWFAASMGFATLGISDLIEPLDGYGQLLMIGNVLSGFVTLGLLLAVLGDNFARRA